MISLAIIGGGPAGLKAAEIAAENGAQVTLYDAKPSVGRKFLVAGKSGLNLTSDEDFELFLTRYQGGMPAQVWRGLIADFDNTATRQWAESLGIQTFVSSGKKVFPEQMKAAPLLRRWVEKLKKLGVVFEMRHKCIDITADEKVCLQFETEAGLVEKVHDKVIFALGGGSWKNTGSDGAWVSMFKNLDVDVVELMSANSGWEVAWSEELLSKAEGKPIKNVAVSSEGVSVQGELVVTRYGLEGGPIYRLGSQIRKTNQVSIDLKPTFSDEQLVKKMESVKKDVLENAKIRWKLSDASFAILKFYHHAEYLSVEELAKLVKHCCLVLNRPRPIEEAISSAGGVSWSELNTHLQLKKYPNIMVAGEMIDWEAPTGGFLLQGCLATGKRAALSAVGVDRRDLRDSLRP